MGIKTSTENKLLSRNYYLTKLSSHFWWYIKSLGKAPLVIYQMGKVGSTSILYALYASNLDMPIYQVHVLSAHGIMKMEQKYWGKTPKAFRKSLLPETKHLFASHFLHAQLNKDLASNKWKIVTLVRDPIARNVSEFFYSVDTTKYDPHLPNFYKQYHSKAISTTELIQRFLERFHENSEEYQLPLKWFDTEFKAVLGIDVFLSDFPKSQGYQIIRGKFADVLLLKLEKLRECSSKAFNRFLNLKDFRLGIANAAQQKRYYPVYKSFINNVDLPDSYVNSVYNSKLVRHFYTNEEISAFRKKWHKL